MVHRGPDDEGHFVGEGVALGMRRLSIIDLAGGHQPIANEDETVWVVCNGEIYNYKELRVELEKQGHVFRTHSDTEVIVHLYEEEGLIFSSGSRHVRDSDLGYESLASYSWPRSPWQKASLHLRGSPAGCVCFRNQSDPEVDGISRRN